MAAYEDKKIGLHPIPSDPRPGAPRRRYHGVAPVPDPRPGAAERQKRRSRAQAELPTWDEMVRQMLQSQSTGSLFSNVLRAMAPRQGSRDVQKIPRQYTAADRASPPPVDIVELPGHPKTSYYDYDESGRLKLNMNKTAEGRHLLYLPGLGGEGEPPPLEIRP